MSNRRQARALASRLLASCPDSAPGRPATPAPASHKIPQSLHRFRVRSHRAARVQLGQPGRPAFNSRVSFATLTTAPRGWSRSARNTRRAGSPTSSRSQRSPLRCRHGQMLAPLRVTPRRSGLRQQGSIHSPRQERAPTSPRLVTAIAAWFNAKSRWYSGPVAFWSSKEARCSGSNR
ncbi:MAG: hypothetical protein ACJA14_001034 [Ilumatobacter sp.]|jgi:hypothetical protein